jgi:subtilisin family serine protease
LLKFSKISTIALTIVLGIPFTASGVIAQDITLARTTLDETGGSADTAHPPAHTWMSLEIEDAWRQGYQGQGTRITVVDDFTSRYGYRGDLGLGTQVRRHGGWTQLEASIIAPSATIVLEDYRYGRAVQLGSNQLNTLNLSYAMFGADGYSNSQIGWSSQENSIISYAFNGEAVVVKAAGNSAVAVDAANSGGNADYLNRALIGAQSVVFVGSLDRNGTMDDKAIIASYSNYSGTDTTVQNQFLMVGVRDDLTRLSGTSFAAPIVSGYSAVIGSKFTTATPTQIANILLDTARTDTIFGYNPETHGRGEASITRALAPISIR